MCFIGALLFFSFLSSSFVALLEQPQNTLPLLFLILLAHIFFKERVMCRNKLTQVAGYSAVKLRYF